jgi:regulator of protease activity HflC (stomatin/prohibitin superfamily)
MKKVLTFIRSYWKWPTLALVAALTIYATFSWVSPRQFGLQTTGYVLLSDHTIGPGLRFQVPFIQYTHQYNANTQVIAMNAGGCRFWMTCDSTGDQNPLRASMVLQYRLIPDPENLGFHEWAMEGFLFTDGYWLLTRMLNTSANAILGQKTTPAVLSEPQVFVEAVQSDLVARLKLNNVPVEVESLELRDFNTWFTPIRTVSYGITKSGKASP